MLKIYYICVILSVNILKITSARPNIVLFMADDLGWNDVSYHDLQHEIPTPNIDALGMNGIILNRYYSQHMCTPSRAALMTGQYPIHTGMQHYVIAVDEPWALPIEYKLLPEYFKDANYGTYMVGKWHLGFHKKIYTPLERGFDHHFGYWGSNIDYWTKLKYRDTDVFGLDFRNETEIFVNSTTYVTEMFTQASIDYIKNHDKRKPLFMMVNHLAPHTANFNDLVQAPEEEINKFNHISDRTRRIYAAMVSLLDKSIGQVISALKENGMLENSIIIFLSDNGAPVTVPNVPNGGSNYPLRGEKDSPWEGGVRVPAVLWSPLIKNPKRISNELFHISDWFPTLLSAAGINLTPKDLKNLDAVDQWKSLVENLSTNRTKLLINIDPVDTWSAIIKDGWKLVNKTTKKDVDRWLTNETLVKHLTDQEYGRLVLDSEVSVAVDSTLTKDEIIHLSRGSRIIYKYLPNWNDTSFTCDPNKGSCLFKIDEDPCEFFNLAEKRPDIVKQLELEIQKYRESMRTPLNQPEDPNCNPNLYNLTWTYWNDIVHVKNIPSIDELK